MVINGDDFFCTQQYTLPPLGLRNRKGHRLRRSGTGPPDNPHIS